MPTTRRVLVVVHTVASANRLNDMLSIFESDYRVQLLFTCPETSAVSNGVAKFLDTLQVPVISWEHALLSQFDLAIAANHTGNLYELNAPLVIISHGIGYTKKIAGSRKPEAGSRKPVYGLSAQSLLHAGEVIADRLVLSHDEQLDRLSREVPEAVDAATIAGDPCLDRIQASTPLREQYRHALGADENTTVVVVSSTWRTGSLLNVWPTFFQRLQAELPIDSYLVVGVLHPHIWFAHGPAQIRSWFAECERAGLRLIAPEQGWQAALVAADVVLGDYGAVTCYATARDIPIALGAFADDSIAEDSPVDLLGRCAHRLDLNARIRPQLEQIIADHQTDRYSHVADLISSCPGESAARLRSMCYELMDLPEPSSEVPTPPYPVASIRAHLGSCRATAAFVNGSVRDDNIVALNRLPADVLVGRADSTPLPDSAHLAAHYAHPIRSLRTNADVLFCREEELTTSMHTWWNEILRTSPATTLAAVTTADGQCLLAGRHVSPVRITPIDAATSAAPDPMIWASAYYLWLCSHGDRQRPRRWVVRTASGEYSARQESFESPTK